MKHSQRNAQRTTDLQVFALLATTFILLGLSCKIILACLTSIDCVAIVYPVIAA